MITENLPLGNAALHPDWPFAQFNLSGMFVHHEALGDLLDLLSDCLDCRPRVEAIHGAPAVVWNAGRPSSVRISRNVIASTIESFNRRNIGYNATFTNNRLTPDHLQDPLGNHILDCIAQRPDLNAVIVTSDLLSRYIADRYATIPQIASIVKISMENGQGRPDYYHELAQRFSRFVVHPDDCRNMELLEQLDREKTEVIVNENCAIHCPHRARHYDLYARRQLFFTDCESGAADSFAMSVTGLAMHQELQHLKSACPAPNDPPCLKRRKRNCNLTYSELKTVHDMGFRHFKLQGRGDDCIQYIYDVTRFLLEPQFVAPMIYKTMLRYASVRGEMLC